MKKNFYFQHSLMSMFDPRMKHLVDNEGLRGLGAYWIIIEKLSILPEPRAQLDYLRAYCDSKKITLCYLKKIILEYDLFELEEDGYFMPKELNPLHKKGEKTEKTTQEKPDSKAKNDEKQQKVSRNKSKKQSDLSSNTLNNKYLAKNATNTNKKTIDINKTTTATTEEKEAAAAGALSSPQTTPAPIEPWHTLIDKLTEESAWLDVHAQRLWQFAEDAHQRGCGGIQAARHTARQRQCAAEHERHPTIFRQLRKGRPAHLAGAAYAVAGPRKAAVRRRTSRPLPLRAACGRTAHLPGLPHPRRSATPTGQYRLLERNDPFVDVANPAAVIEKAETETRLKRHTPAPGMPHVSVPNATCQRSECHTSARPKCGIYPREVWHFNPLSVAFQPLRLP